MMLNKTLNLSDLSNMKYGRKIATDIARFYFYDIDNQVCEFKIALLLKQSD